MDMNLVSLRVTSGAEGPDEGKSRKKQVRDLGQVESRLQSCLRMRCVHFIPILTEAVVSGQWFDI